MKKCNKVFFILAIAIFCIFLQSCNHEDIQPNTPCKRTILVYMIATNSLGNAGYDESDLNEMEYAVQNYNLNNCRLIVYYTSYSLKYPILFEIIKDKDTVKRITLKNYSNSSNSCSVSRLSEVILDMKAMCPAMEYGLVLWSHSTGWALYLNKSSKSKNLYFNSNKPLCRNFGEDAGVSMPINDLALALPDSTFEFIYADACYMGSVEIAYQIRNKTHYYIGSPTLLPADGMPYDQNVPEFVKDVPDLVQACKNTYDYYNSKSGINKTCSISLIDCMQLSELATFCLNNFGTKYKDNVEIQHYIDSNDADCIYYDFMQNSYCWLENNSFEAFNSILSKCILFKASTPYIFNQLKIDTTKFSGLSTYKFGTGSSENEQYYHTLDWYQDVFVK